MMTDILSILTGTDVLDTSKVIKQGWHDVSPFMTGCLIITKNVFSICPGTVIDIGKDNKNNLYSITIEYDYSTWIRYCMLESYSVSKGQEVSAGTKLGIAYKNNMRFEYCTYENSSFAYRNGNRQLYKHDPMVVLSGEVELLELDPEVYIIEDEEYGNQSE